MNANRVLISLLVLTAAGSLRSAESVRDPFWPIGYAPAPPPTVQNEGQTHPQKTEPVKPQRELSVPVTEDDWNQARKALNVSGVTRSVRADTQETRVLGMINRRLYSIGDTLGLVHANIRFQWRIVSIEGNAINLEPLHAERLSENEANALKQKR